MARTSVVLFALLLSSAGGAAAQYGRKCSEVCFQQNDRCFKDCDRTDPGSMLDCKKPCYEKVDRCFNKCMAGPPELYPAYRGRSR